MKHTSDVTVDPECRGQGNSRAKAGRKLKRRRWWWLEGAWWQQRWLGGGALPRRARGRADRET